MPFETRVTGFQSKRNCNQKHFFVNSSRLFREFPFRGNHIPCVIKSHGWARSRARIKTQRPHGRASLRSFAKKAWDPGFESPRARQNDTKTGQDLFLQISTNLVDGLTIRHIVREQKLGLTVSLKYVQSSIHLGLLVEVL